MRYMHNAKKVLIQEILIAILPLSYLLLLNRWYYYMAAVLSIFVIIYPRYYKIELIVNFIKNVFLWFATSSNHEFMISNGYLLETKNMKIYSNGQCAWFFNTVHSTPIWELKKKILDEARLFYNGKIQYKLISQHRSFEWKDEEVIVTSDVKQLASEYSKLIGRNSYVYERPLPCIHVFKGKARVRVYNGVFLNSESLIEELTECFNQ